MSSPFQFYDDQNNLCGVDELGNYFIIKHGGPMPEALKKDEGKTDWSLLPLKCMEEVMKVYTWGATRHNREKNQWRYGTKWSRYWNATMRHIVAFWRGEDLDPESNLHHLAHAICNMMMLFEMLSLKQFDDRENWMGQKGKGKEYTLNDPPVPPMQRVHLFEPQLNQIGYCTHCDQHKNHMVHSTERVG